MNMASSRRILVLGLGDPARGDEAAGARAVELLAATFDLPPNVQTLMATAPDLDVLDALEEVTTLLAVDSVYAEGGPGTVFRVPLDEYERDAETPESLHEEALLQTLGVLEVLGQRPEGVLLIVPVARPGVGEGLSPEVESQLPAVVAKIVTELRGCGVVLERA